MDYYLAIDQGTHASRAILYNQKGEVITGQVKPVNLLRKKNGHVEQDPQEILNSVNAVIENLLASLPPDMRNNIKACGIATQRSTVVALDHAGHSLSPAISWQDVRGTAYLDNISLTSEQIWEISGLPLSPHYSASKCRWLLEHHKRVRSMPLDNLFLAPLSSFLLMHLAKPRQFVIDHSNAQRMQLLDLKSMSWSKELIHAFQIPLRLLPTCRPMCDDYGLLRYTNIPITAVCGDQNAAMFGNGELSKDSVFINLGSGAFILRMLPELLKTPHLLTSIAKSTRQEVQYLQEATVNGAGNALNWFLDQYPIENWQAQLPIWLREIDNPPIFINAVGELGSPWWSNQVEPHFIGDGGISEKLVAVIESIVFLIQNNLDIIGKQHPLSLIKVSGGLSKSEGACQKLANLSQLPVQQTSDTEATARGVAWLASGREKHWDETTPGCYFKPAPDPGLQKRYQQFNRHLNEALNLNLPVDRYERLTG